MLQRYMMSSHYLWKCTNKEKLIPLYGSICECGVVVGRLCRPWGQGLGFDYWWYPLLHNWYPWNTVGHGARITHVSPPFLPKKTRMIQTSMKLSGQTMWPLLMMYFQLSSREQLLTKLTSWSTMMMQRSAPSMGSSSNASTLESVPIKRNQSHSMSTIASVA